MPKQAAPYAAAPGEVEVDRVVCASMAVIEGSAFAQMELIRTAALRNNPSRGIHGSLSLQSGWFVHWAEGPAAAIRGLLEHTRSDPRHRARHIVHHSHGKRLLPTAWSMMISSTSEDAVHMGRRVLALADQMARGQQRSPQSVIRRLVVPMRLAAAQDMADPDGFHRVGVTAAGGNDAFDLVNWLADHHSEAVIRHRVAGLSDLDSGTAYVEFMEHGHPCRLIAVTRNSLAHGLRRAFLPDWGHFLLLFSGKQSTDHDLMRRMIAACKGLVTTPVLLGVAPSAATHAEMLAMASAAGLDYLAAGTIARHELPAIWGRVSEQLQQAGEPPSSVWDVPEPRLVA